MHQQCDYFDAGTCRSCTLLPQPYASQLADKVVHAQGVLGSRAPLEVWALPVASAPMGFRNKAKLAVGGRLGDVTLGILDAGGEGLDLRGCGLYEPGLAALLPLIATFLNDLAISPYDVPSRRGELKYVLVTHSPAGSAMVRFVLRSQGEVARLRKHLPRLLVAAPSIRVVSANIHPEHKAVLEGDLEIALTEEADLPMLVNDITLHLRPRSFFQTNTEVASALYRQAREWIDELAPRSVLDLYCGVGGFAFHALERDSAPVKLDSGPGEVVSDSGGRTQPPRRAITGIEVSEDAIACANLTAAGLGRTAKGPAANPNFRVGDAADLGQFRDAPELIIVNPPRRGIGPELSTWIERGETEALIYSSCNVTTMAADLAQMSSMTTATIRLFDMFPNTDHSEVLALLRRR